MTLWNKIKIAALSLRLIRDPERTELIFKAIDIAAKDPDPALVAIENEVMKETAFARMYGENYFPENPAMDRLASCPAGTFGHAVHRHLQDNGLSLDLFPRHRAHRPIEYLSLRIYQDHDLWHPLLGYGIEIEDELAVQAFGVAQFKGPMGILLVAGGLIHLLLKAPLRAPDALGKVAEGYARGARAKFMLSLRLHEMFDRPLDEVRAVCGIAA